MKSFWKGYSILLFFDCMDHFTFCYQSEKKLTLTIWETQILKGKWLPTWRDFKIKIFHFDNADNGWVLIYCVWQKLYHNWFLLVSFFLTNIIEKMWKYSAKFSVGTYFCILHNRSHINIDLLCKVAWTPSLTSSIKCSHIDWKADKWNNTCWQLGVISYRDLDSNHQLLRHFLK